MATGTCPWFPDGKHRNGCGCTSGAPSQREADRRGRQAQEYEKAKDKNKENFDKKADEFIAKRPGGSTTYDPNPFPGVTMVKDEVTGIYHYVRR